ncbi:MAG: hypothetical protein ACRCYT_02415 [Cetobacterium sp.]
MEKNFLILVEGRKDPNTIAKKFKDHFEDILKYKFLDILGEEKLLSYLELLKINLKKDSTPLNTLDISNPQNIITLSFDSVNKDLEKHEINIYIKRANSQNIGTFNDLIKGNTSLKKYYNLNKELTYSYSIFDYDPGSTNTNIQLQEYFNLKNQAENFYPVINYPCIEAQDFHYNYKKIIEKYSQIEDKLFLLKEIFILKESLFYLKKQQDISVCIKKIHIQLMRILENIPSEDKVLNYWNYLKNALNEVDSIEILERQEDFYINEINQENEFLLISFIFSVFENICEWIIEEDE